MPLFSFHVIKAPLEILMLWLLDLAHSGLSWNTWSLKGWPLSRQKGHLAALSHRQNICNFFLTLSVEEKPLAPKKMQIWLSSVVCSFCSPLLSLQHCFSVVHKDVLSPRKTPRHGEPDTHDPCHVIRKRESK